MNASSEYLFDSYFDANDNLSPKSILSIFQDEARHGKAFEGLLARYFG